MQRGVRDEYKVRHEQAQENSPPKKIKHVLNAYLNNLRGLENQLGLNHWGQIFGPTHVWIYLQ